MGWEDGYWNGLPTKIRKVTGVVKDWDKEIDPPRAWWRYICGETVDAVEVVLDDVNHRGGHIFLYEDAESNHPSGWYKVTEGRGSPRVGHSEVRLILDTVKDREC